DSTSPTPAIIRAYVNTISSASQFTGTIGIGKVGREPLTDAMPSTFLVSMRKKKTRADVRIIATKDAGIAVVNREHPNTTRMVNNVRPPMMYRFVPVIQEDIPFSTTLNCCT